MERKRESHLITAFSRPKKLYFRSLAEASHLWKPVPRNHEIMRIDCARKRRDKIKKGKREGGLQRQDMQAKY